MKCPTLANSVLRQGSCALLFLALGTSQVRAGTPEASGDAPFASGTSQVRAGTTSREEIALLEGSAARQPNSPDAYFDLIMGYSRTPVLERGIDLLRKIQQIDPGYPQKIAARYEEQLRENPANVEVYWRLAFAKYFQGRESGDRAAMGQAQQLLRRVIEIDPNYVWAYNYLSYITYEAGDLPGALDLARKAVDLDPDNAVAHFLLGQALLKGGQPFAAAGHLARAMQLRNRDFGNLPQALVPIASDSASPSATAAGGATAPRIHN